MRKLNPLGWPVNLLSGGFIIAAATVIAVQSDHSWSWPLFVWGAAFGPVASAWAHYTTDVFGRMVMQRVPASGVDALEARRQGQWRKWRATYAGMVLLGIGVGVIAASVHSATPDAILTIVWVVIGVLPGLIGFPLLLRRLDRQVDRLRQAEADAGDEQPPLDGHGA